MRFFLINFFALLNKELKQCFKNARSRGAILAPPLAQIIVFGYAATFDLQSIRFAVLDHDHTASSRQLAEAFTGSGIFRIAANPANEAELTRNINNRDILAALVIPQNFERNLSNGKNSDIQLLVDGRNSNTANIASGYAARVADQFRTRLKLDSGLPAQPHLEVRAWYNPNYNMRYFMVPALLTMISLLDVMLLSSMSIAREREEGTFDQLLVAPYSPGEILGAKLVCCVLVGLGQVALAYTLGRLWFDIPLYGSHLMLLATFLIFLAASVSCGLLISVLSHTLQQSMLGTFLVAVPFALLSGISTPVESMPKFLQYLTSVNPMRYGLQVLQRIFLEGSTWGQLWIYYLMMGSISVSALSVAYLIFRKQLRG